MADLGQLTNQSTFEEVADALIGETIRRGYSRDKSVAVTSTGIQESTLRMIKHANADWWGYFQQDSSYPNRKDPAGNIRGFLDRLDQKMASPGASPDIWKNIFWLQQRPGDLSAEVAYAKGRKAYLEEIKRHIDRAEALYSKYSGGPSVGWTGDPTWLESVLREALGTRLVVEPGWAERGTGGFMGDIWGVMIHHTGNVNETVANIRDGVQQPSGWLPGPLSQGLIKPDGTFHLVAIGPCNHAGGGSYGSLTNGNRDSIGFECAYGGSGRWPDRQIWTMRDASAAILKRLGYRGDRICGHKEYAKPAGRKVDPGNMVMDWFREEVNKKLDGKIPPGQPDGAVPPVVIPGPITWIDNIKDYSDRRVIVELWHQLRGLEGEGWSQLDGLTPVDFLEQLGKRQKSMDAKLDSIISMLSANEE